MSEPTFYVLMSIGALVACLTPVTIAILINWRAP